MAMTEEQFNLKVRLDTMSYLLATAIADSYAARGWTAKQVKAHHAGLIEHMQGHAEPSMDPVMSDAYAAALEEELRTHLASVEAIGGYD